MSIIKEAWLDINNISSYIGDFNLISDLTLKLYKNENTILLGPNGSGKSTIINLINSSIKPIIKDSSHFKIFNSNTINLQDLRKRIGFVDYNNQIRINNTTKVDEVIKSSFFGAYSMSPINKLNEKHLELLNRTISDLELQNIVYKKYGDLSSGQKQIVQLARALVNDPEIIILDEPTNNLDIRSKTRFLKIIHMLTNKNKTFLIATHDNSLLSNLFKRTICVKDRKIIFNGLTINTVNSKNLSILYDLPITVSNANGHYIVQVLNNE